MRQPVMPRAIAAGAVVAAAGLVLLTRPSPEEPSLTEAEPSPPPTPTIVAATRDDAIPAQAPETALTEKRRELEAMSETFRNTTFLIAIRDTGFVCNELLRVYGGGDDTMGWIVTCSEMLAYTVSVASGGALRVEPTLQYFDSLTPITIRREPGEAPLPAQRPPEVLPPLR